MNCLACQDTGWCKIKTPEGIKQMRCLVCGGVTAEKFGYVWVLMQIGPKPVVYYAVVQKDLPESPKDVQPIAGHRLVWAKVTLRKTDEQIAPQQVG